MSLVKVDKRQHAVNNTLSAHGADEVVTERQESYGKSPEEFEESDYAVS
jgi:hypothetical protein